VGFGKTVLVPSVGTVNEVWEDSASSVCWYGKRGFGKTVLVPSVGTVSGVWEDSACTVGWYVKRGLGRQCLYRRLVR